MPENTSEKSTAQKLEDAISVLTKGIHAIRGAAVENKEKVRDGILKEYNKIMGSIGPVQIKANTEEARLKESAKTLYAKIKDTNDASLLAVSQRPPRNQSPVTPVAKASPEKSKDELRRIVTELETEIEAAFIAKKGSPEETTHIESAKAKLQLARAETGISKAQLDKLSSRLDSIGSEKQKSEDLRIAREKERAETAKTKAAFDKEQALKAKAAEQAKQLEAQRLTENQAFTAKQENIKLFNQDVFNPFNDYHTKALKEIEQLENAIPNLPRLSDEAMKSIRLLVLALKDNHRIWSQGVHNLIDKFQGNQTADISPFSKDYKKLTLTFTSSSRKALHAATTVLEKNLSSSDRFMNGLRTLGNFFIELANSVRHAIGKTPYTLFKPVVVGGTYPVATAQNNLLEERGKSGPGPSGSGSS